MAAVVVVEEEAEEVGIRTSSEREEGVGMGEEGEGLHSYQYKSRLIVT